MPFLVNGININDLAQDGSIDSALSPYYPGLPPTTTPSGNATTMLDTKYKYTSNSIDISGRIMAAVMGTATSIPAGSIPTWCNRVSILMVGGGGGGGGGVGNYNTAFVTYYSAAGGNGASGTVYASPDNIIVNSGSPYSISIGAGGGGGGGSPGSPSNQAGGTGNPGGTTTVNISGGTYNAGGGGGGGGASDHTAPSNIRDSVTGSNATGTAPLSAPGAFWPIGSYGSGGGGGAKAPNGSTGGAGTGGAVWMWFKYAF